MKNPLHGAEEAKSCDRHGTEHFEPPKWFKTEPFGMLEICYIKKKTERLSYKHRRRFGKQIHRDGVITLFFLSPV